ncbi:IS4 family transposase [Thauera aminoaromatica S2]|uniref:IS4 family transposase n=1 Tax=Thauera aminoaromatica S2 TaxID=1234381 RepID=N6YXZ6_THASP|nr:IS4 family transposase [Thauera aminoaromatica S2]
MRNTAPFCPTASCERLLISSHQRGRAGVERGFKVLKSDIEIATVYHRLPERIRTHASICFMALILPRVVRSRLKAADAGYTPERALEQLQRIQHHRVRLNGGEPMEGTSAISTEHKAAPHALGIEKPAAPEQLTLL